jgi:hypothetical protein
MFVAFIVEVLRYCDISALNVGPDCWKPVPVLKGYPVGGEETEVYIAYGNKDIYK